MSGSSIQFHKIWIEQCAATEGIRERFGLESALGYLIGEKIFSFVRAARSEIPISPPSSRRSSPKSGGSLRPKRFAPILTAWSVPSSSLRKSRIWRWMIWTTKPRKSLGRTNSVLGAEELLRFSRVRQLLQE
jgi:hypothetical protein